VVRAGQEHERRRHDQQHVVVVGHRDAAVPQEAAGEEARAEGAGEEDQPHRLAVLELHAEQTVEGRQAVGPGEEAGREVLGAVGEVPGRPGRQRHHEDEQQADARRGGLKPALGGRQQQRLEEAQQGEAGDGDLGEDRQPVGRARGERLEGGIDVGEQGSHRAEGAGAAAGRVSATFLAMSLQ